MINYHIAFDLDKTQVGFGAVSTCPGATGEVVHYDNARKVKPIRKKKLHPWIKNH